MFFIQYVFNTYFKKVNEHNTKYVFVLENIVIHNIPVLYTNSLKAVILHAISLSMCDSLEHQQLVCKGLLESCTF